MKKQHGKLEFHGYACFHRVRVEFKRADAPRVMRSMQDLKIDTLYAVYPGERRFKLAPGIEAVSLWAVLQ